MAKKIIYHLNDRTLKYQTLAQNKRQHQYLGLLGEYRTSLPQEIVFPNLDFGRADALYYNDEGLLIDLEEESGKITKITLRKFGKYVCFGAFRYSENIYLAVLCHQDPKKDFEYFEVGPSFHIKVHYYYFSQKELWDSYDNLIKKVKQKEKLTDKEALDIGFLSKFISKEHASEIVEALTTIFCEAIIEDKLLKMDVGVILGGMILKHISDIEKQNKLLRRINMRHIEKEIDKLVYDEYGEELDKKDKEIEEKNKEIDKLNKSNAEYKTKIEQLNQLEDLNTPKAKKILQQLMLL